MENYQITMPRFGETVEEVTVLGWLKEPGDRIAKGEGIAEIETDKIETELESVVSGVIVRFLVDAGDTVAVGEAIAVVATE